MRKMMLWKKIALVVLALMLTCTAMASGFDIDKTGSISVRIHTAKEKNVKNAKIELYRVGDPVIIDSNLHFELSADFAGSGLSVDDLNSAGLADSFAAYAKGMKLTPYAAAVTDENGVVVFGDLPVGLYMIRQNGFTKKMYFTQITPFLVSMPMTNEEGTGWDYFIEASPKVNTVAKPTPSPAPTATPDPTLPQTGMLRWPIPVLGISGLLLFSLGWAMCFMKRKDA